MIGALCEHYSWPHDFWRRMGWRELRSWLRTMNRSLERRAKRTRTDPDSWEGEELDGWWGEQRAKRTRERGR